MTSPAKTEQTFLVGRQWNGLYRDRYSYQRDTILEEAVRAWRLNPLARQITNLYKIYNVDGIGFKCEHPGTQKFLTEFWEHELNDMENQLEQIANEVFLTGTLFELFSVDSAGMVYFRVFPTDQMSEIVTAPNDIMQTISYITKPLQVDVEAKIYPNPRGRVASLTPQFMKHETINQLAGAAWGEGEIWPDLPWLGRYASFLEDRVRLNRYRNSFIYDVQIEETDVTKINTRKSQLLSNPPQQGDINVHGTNETWSVLSPKLESRQAETDGLQVKKMIMVNHAPMHYAAEPESSTRTTADAAGTPTFKAFESRQKKFKSIILNILKTAVTRRALTDESVDAKAKIEITAADATERDNAALALAMSQIVAAVGELYDRKLVEEEEYLRLIYRFGGETLPQNFKAPKGIRRPIDVSKPANTNSGLKTDSATGEIKVPEKAK